MTGLSRRQCFIKRAFDLVIASALLIAAWPLIVVAAVAASIDTRECGIFTQVRIGRYGTPFRVLKIRTMRPQPEGTTVTTSGDPRITRLGRTLRRYKIDELPQLVNVIRGEMSLVGPRPDVPGFADMLTGDDRIVLSLRPGITGPASVAFRHEEDLLVYQENPERYNQEVLWPAKVAINRAYLLDWTVRRDVALVLKTVTLALGAQSE